MKIISITCDCGREVKTYRGLIRHIDAGCPCNVYDFFQQGVTIEHLEKMYARRSKAKLKSMILLESIRRKVRSPSISSVPV